MKYIALLGLGTVGRGVAELLEKNAAVIRAKTGEELCLRYILVRRDQPESPYADKLIRDFAVIENDREISLVAECIGGTGAALEYVRRALLAGISVVTSNKELVAEHGLELQRLARERNAQFLFEGSVGGGIPLLRPLSQCLAANRISEVCGIINGTTNYILSRMGRSGAGFAEALGEAQSLGYAESDPTADVTGLDAARKLCILADLCFGKNVAPADIFIQGITGITAEDIAAAAALGGRLKLLGRARQAGESSIIALTAPHFVPEENPLAGIEGVTNAVALRGDAVGETLLCGPGAGSLPTASAVVGDLIDAALHWGDESCLRWREAPAGWLADVGGVPERWFLRFDAQGWQKARAALPVTAEAPERFALLTEPMTALSLKGFSPVSAFRVLR